MFYRGFPALMPHVRPDAITLPRVAGMRAARAESDAMRAMNRDLGSMKLSERLKNPSGWNQLQRARRDCLEALLAVPPSRAVAERAADLICMIAEESLWSANPTNVPFDDEGHPEIDLQAAETAVLFGWTRRVLGPLLNEISPRITGRMLSEVRRRILKPVLAHEDYPFMKGEGACPMTIAADIILTCLLMETDEARAARVLKPALRIMDEICGRHGRALAPLTGTITDISAASDLAALLKRMTHGSMDLTENIPANDWLDEILYAWIHGPYFNDPAGCGMTPPVSGSDIFRIGLAAGDDALTALGAQLHNADSIPPRTVTGRLMDLSACALLEAENGRPPRLRYAATRNNLLMAARIPGLYCAMHTGGGRGNAGDLCLFADDLPILADGGDCAFRNLPVLSGSEQLAVPSRPCVADFEDREDREIMSVDLTHAYPAECALRSYQRTVLTLREEHTVRIVDALQFDEPAEVMFSFVTAVRPAVLNAAVRLGPVRLTWEGGFTANARPMENGLTRLELTADAPVERALFAFNFERA